MKPSIASSPAAVPDVDLALVARVLVDDDRHAFAELVRRHQSAVRSLLRRLSENDAALADDLAQETFLQIYRKLNQFRGDAKFTTWIYRIAYNVFLADVRASQKFLQQFVQQTDSSADESAMDHSQLPVATGTALKLDLEKAMAMLSEGERAAIVQCYYQDLSHEEAAYVLDCPLGTLKSNILRARNKLKTAMAAWAPPSERRGTA